MGKPGDMFKAFSDASLKRNTRRVIKKVDRTLKKGINKSIGGIIKGGDSVNRRIAKARGKQY